MSSRGDFSFHASELLSPTGGLLAVDDAHIPKTRHVPSGHNPSALITGMAVAAMPLCLAGIAEHHTMITVRDSQVSDDFSEVLPSLSDLSALKPLELSQYYSLQTSLSLQARVLRQPSCSCDMQSFHLLRS